jgi:glycosyltransferase involved in cell wall biosynthesis
MAVLNGDRFIDEAIASVLAQTYPHWELLIVDDGSTDRTPAIIRDYEARYPQRIRGLEHPDHANRGESASRNLGMAHARGTYIAFLDADDAYLPLRLARHVALLEGNREIDVVVSDTLRWYSWSDPGVDDVRIKWPPVEAETLIRAPGMLLRSFDRKPRDGYFPSTCSVTFRRSALDDVGDFETRFGVCDDWAFFSKLYLHKNVYVTTDVLAKYRKHRDSVMHRMQDGRQPFLSPQYHYHVRYLRWLKQLLQERNAEPVLIERTRQQLWPEGAPLLTGMLGLPPALELAWRTTNAKRVLSCLLSSSAYQRLKHAWHVLKRTERYVVVAARTLAVLAWSVLPPSGS